MSYSITDYSVMKKGQVATLPFFRFDVASFPASPYAPA